MRRQGQTLLEGMIAAVLLAIGVTAIIQAILVSTIQNAGAAKMNEAATIANQLATLLQRYGFDELTAASGPLGSGCVSVDATNEEFLDNVHIAPTGYTACAVDVDDFDTTETDPLLQVVPGYDIVERSRVYRRFVVLYENADGVTRLREATVVVSFTEAGRRRFAKRVVGFIPNTGNAGFVQL